MSPKEIIARLNPKEVEELDNIIRDSYDNFVRLERRNLLITSSVIFFSSFSGLNPSKGTLFGFSFNNLSVETFYLIVLLVNIYFLVAFSIYATPAYRNARLSRKSIIDNSGKLSYQRPWYSFEIPNFKSNSRYYIWMFVHFILPLSMGLVASIVGVAQIALRSN